MDTLCSQKVVYFCIEFPKIKYEKKLCNAGMDYCCNRTVNCYLRGEIITYSFTKKKRMKQSAVFCKVEVNIV